MKKLIKTIFFSFLFAFVLSPSISMADNTEVKLVVPESEKEKLHDVEIYDISEYFTYDENKYREEQALELFNKVKDLDLTEKFVAKTEENGEIKVSLDKEKSYFVKGKNIASFVIIGQTDLTMIPEEGLVVRMKPEDDIPEDKPDKDDDIPEKEIDKDDDIPEKKIEKDDDIPEGDTTNNERVKTGITGTKIVIGILVLAGLGYGGSVLYKKNKK